MLIASWPLHEFAGFIQIISWITLPVLLISVLGTMGLHYYQRQRRKRVDEFPFTDPEIQQDPLPFRGSGSRQVPVSVHQARYRALKKDFDVLQGMYHANEEELASLNAEMRRQDDVIDQLRSDLVSLEKNLSHIRHALELKEEQLTSMEMLAKEKNTGPAIPLSRPSIIAAEIS